MTLEESLFNVEYRQKGKVVRKGPALPGDDLVESLLHDLEAKKTELDEILKDPSDVLPVWKIEKIESIYDYVASLRPKLPENGSTVQIDTQKVVERMRADEGAIRDFIGYIGDYVECVKGHPKNYSEQYCIDAQKKGPRFRRALQAWRALQPHITERPQISAAPIISRLRNKFLKPDYDIESYKMDYVQKQLRSRTRASSSISRLPGNKSIFDDLYHKAELRRSAGLGIPQKSEHPQSAEEFLSYMNQNSANRSWKYLLAIGLTSALLLGWQAYKTWSPQNGSCFIGATQPVYSIGVNER
jgi:hypothetical protein